MADKSFTFWKNMLDTIDKYENYPEYQLKLYKALTEYGIYGIWPEDDGTRESIELIAFVQSFLPSLDKSSGYIERCAESGSRGGKAQKVSDDQLKNCIIEATKKFNKVPTRKQIVDIVKELYDIEINEKTVSRRIPDEEKKRIAEETLRDISMSPKDIGHVPGTLGHNKYVSEDMGHVPYVSDVPEGHINVSETLKKFNW